LIPDIRPLDNLLSGGPRRKGLDAAEDHVLLMDYVLAFDHAASVLCPGGGLDALIERGNTEEAIALIQDSGLAEALHSYARRIRNKGELGVLATVNVKAWADLRDRMGLGPQELAVLEALPEDYEPTVVVLPDRVILVGGPEKRVKVKVLARPLGATDFAERVLASLGRSSYALVFPEEVEGAGSVEYGIEVVEGRRKRFEWPRGFPAATATATTYVPRLASVPAPPASGRVTPVAVEYGVSPDWYSVILEWTPEPGEAYAVYRNGAHLATVADGWFEDLRPVSGSAADYGVVARSLWSGLTAYAAAPVSLPGLPLPEPPASLHLATRANRVVLGWFSDSPQAGQYNVVKYNEDLEPVGEIIAAADYGHYLQATDRVEGGTACTYSVAGAAPDGRVGAPSSLVGVIASSEPARPRVQLSFEDTSFLMELSQIADNALAVGGKGWSELARQPQWDPERALTLSLWVKLDDVEGAPVLICKGPWEEVTYFLQLVGGRIRFHMADLGTLDGGSPQPGVWQHIAAVYGFGEMRIYLNGVQTGRKNVAGVPPLDTTPLLAPRYGLSEETYYVHGLLDDIRIYDVALTGEEVRILREKTRR
ncbi:MAG TPA: LamG domain-containing protein, partial [Candidatus Hydrogenedentes bacterium]|nr:LamG domain-containing protein [Candidatus Hydrogenedentota bacterium]